ncbi:MAG: TetR/AcrR family transcriptional regulator [Gammaproteobacteria bacterium]
MPAMAPTNDTKQRILASAQELIYSRSYSGMGVAAICAHAGVKKGSFYHFFTSKQALTLEALDTFYINMKQGVIDQAFVEDIPPLSRLVRLAQLVYEFQKHIKDETSHILGCPFGNLASELATQDEQIREKIDHIFRKLQGHITEVLQKAIVAEDIHQIDVNATAQAMLAYFEGVLLLAKTRNGAEVIQQLLPAMAEIRISQT